MRKGAEGQGGPPPGHSAEAGWPGYSGGDSTRTEGEEERPAGTLPKLALTLFPFLLLFLGLLLDWWIRGRS
jgi:hypothetical protein